MVHVVSQSDQKTPRISQDTQIRFAVQLQIITAAVHGDQFSLRIDGTTLTQAKITRHTRD